MKVRKILQKGLVGGLVLAPVLSAKAGWQAPTAPTNVPENLTGTADSAIISIINWVLGFVAAIAVLFLIIGGVQYLTSAGNTTQAESGKDTIKNAVIGLVICGLAYAVVYAIINDIL